MENQKLLTQADWNLKMTEATKYPSDINNHAKYLNGHLKMLSDAHGLGSGFAAIVDESEDVGQFEHRKYMKLEMPNSCVQFAITSQMEFLFINNESKEIEVVSRSEAIKYFTEEQWIQAIEDAMLKSCEYIAKKHAELKSRYPVEKPIFQDPPIRNPLEHGFGSR